GMAYEARLAEALGVAETGTARRICGLLEGYGLPVELPDTATVDGLVAAMQLDKKTRDGTVRFALPRAVGAMCGDRQAGWTVTVPRCVPTSASVPVSPPTMKISPMMMLVMAPPRKKGPGTIRRHTSVRPCRASRPGTNYKPVNNFPTRFPPLHTAAPTRINRRSTRISPQRLWIVDKRRTRAAH